MSHELYREDGESFRSVRVGIRHDRLRVDTQDMGPATEAVWGDSDYEFWTAVGREHWGDLAVALIRSYWRAIRRPRNGWLASAESTTFRTIRAAGSEADRKPRMA